MKITIEVFLKNCGAVVQRISKPTIVTLEIIAVLPKAVGFIILLLFKK